MSKIIQINWKQIAIEDALSTRQRLTDEDEDIVIDFDKRFMRYHKELLTIVAPKGEKRVG